MLRAIVSAGGQAMRQNLVIPNTGDITVTRGSGKLACDHVIHVNCSKWHGGTGELVSDIIDTENEEMIVAVNAIYAIA